MKKNILLGIAALFLLFACKKEKMLTPCGNDIEPVVFNKQALLLDSAILLTNNSDVSNKYYVKVYFNGSMNFSNYAYGDSIPINSSDTVYFNELLDIGNTYHFGPEIDFDSIVIDYWVYAKGCAISSLDTVYWSYGYATWPYAKDVLTR